MKIIIYDNKNKFFYSKHILKFSLKKNEKSILTFYGKTIYERITL